MRSIRTFLIVFLISGCAGYVASVIAGESIAVITQSSNSISSLTTEDLKRIYLRKNLLDSNGNRWIPLNLPINNEVRRVFSLALFKSLPEEQEQYWNEQYFQGISPPEVLASEEAVVRFVTITPGSIGYVNRRSADNRVKILKIIPYQEKNN